MQSIHPRRRRALGYILILCGLVIGIVGLFAAGNHYPDASSMHVKLTSMGGLLMVVLVLFVIPFITFAWKYWKLIWENGPLPPADTAVHSVSVWCTTGMFNFLGHRYSLSWNNSTQVVTMTAGNNGVPQTIFEVPFKEVRWFDVTLGCIRVHVNGNTYTCSPISGVYTGALWGGARAAAIMGTVIANSEILNEAGVPELARRLHAQGVNVRFDHIGKRFETVFDALFVLLCIGVLLIGIIAP